MLRVFGISLGLIGMTVAGGMGLSYVHDSFYANPTPVRAQVVAPAPVVLRVMSVDASSPVIEAEPTERIASVRAIPSISDAVEVTGAAASAGPVPASLKSSTGLTGIETPLMPAPLASLRPPERQNVTVSRTARLTPTLKRQPKQQQVAARRKPARVSAPAIHRPQPVVSQLRHAPLQTARALPPNVLIGVYR